MVKALIASGVIAFVLAEIVVAGTSFNQSGATNKYNRYVNTIRQDPYISNRGDVYNNSRRTSNEPARYY